MYGDKSMEKRDSERKKGRYPLGQCRVSAHITVAKTIAALFIHRCRGYWRVYPIALSVK